MFAAGEPLSLCSALRPAAAAKPSTRETQPGPEPGLVPRLVVLPLHQSPWWENQVPSDHHAWPDAAVLFP